MQERIELVTGDITKLAADAIVNAANTSLLGGGGVDGAIHRAAGPQLVEACRRLHGCKTGEAKITPGFNLPAKFVIHTVGPVWQDGTHNEDALLARCYQNSLALVVQNHLKTIAFPAISTGIYAFPIERATRIALTETRAFLASHDTIELVTFVCFSASVHQMYQNVLAAL